MTFAIKGGRSRVPLGFFSHKDRWEEGGGGPTLNAKSHDSFPFFWIPSLT